MSTCASLVTVEAARPAIFDVDDEMFALALQLEEAGAHGLEGKGKFPAGSPPDSVIAFDNFQTELDTHLTFLRDLKLAHSIAHAVDTDADLIAQLAGSEDQAHDDHNYALQLGGLTSYDEDEGEELSFASPSSTSSSSSSLRNNTASHPQWLTGIATSIHAADDAESSVNIMPSTTYEDKQAKAIESLSQEYECSVCFEQYHACSIVTLPCHDRYCLDCLKNLFVRATRDESLFPPRCCRKEIGIDLISHELTRAQLNAFKKAEVEYTTSDRTYCSNTTCGSFIPPIDIMADKAFCTQCASETCTYCKKGFHQGLDCPADTALHQALSLAEREGWQRCYACGHVVQLDIGCHHMKCKCGASFCYVCGERWKTCRCDHWSEHRLYARAQQVAQRDAPVALPQAQLGRRVELVRDRLRDNPDCVHPSWQLRTGGGLGGTSQCEMCANSFVQVEQCQRCDMMVCRDCRRNQMR